jgi:CrcB protein
MPLQSDYDRCDVICQRGPGSRYIPTAPILMSLWRSMLAVALGGMVGCLLRWCLALLFNRYFPNIPPGTLAANLIGCYVIGVAIAVFAGNPAIPVEWRLVVTTGFCGGLTTFSTFSAEVVLLLQSGRLAWAAGAITLHLVGSLLMTLAGIATVTLLRS